jgi:hypothetical protein
MMANYFHVLTLPEVSLLIFVARPMVLGDHPDSELVPKRKVTPVPHPTFPFPCDKVYLRGSMNLLSLPLHRLYLKISLQLFSISCSLNLNRNHGRNAIQGTYRGREAPYRARMS